MTLSDCASEGWRTNMCGAAPHGDLIITVSSGDWLSAMEEQSL